MPAFAGTNITRMKAGFATTGAKVTVNGELQVTEQMVHDFSTPIKYIVEAEDGARRLIRSNFPIPNCRCCTFLQTILVIDSKEVYIPGSIIIKAISLRR